MAIFTLIVNFLATGCARNQGILGVDNHSDIPAGALPGVLGEKACGWHTAQAASAAFDRQVFYNADFVGETAQIAPAAYRHFATHAGQGTPDAAIPIVLEPSGRVELDQQRIVEISAVAAQLGMSNVQVQVGFPPALGLIGIDAERIGRGGGGNNRNGNGGGFGGNRGGGLGAGQRTGGIF